LSRIIHQIVGGALGKYVGIFFAEGVAEGEEAVRYLMGYCAGEGSGSAASRCYVCWLWAMGCGKCKSGTWFNRMISSSWLKMYRE